jgi:hypothetical protein
MISTKAWKTVQTALIVVAIAGGIRLAAIYGGCLTGHCRISADAYDDKMATLEKTDPKLVQYTEGRRIPTGLGVTRGIAVGKDGAIYVAGDSGVRVFHADGSHIKDIRLTGETYALSIGAKGMVYAALKDHLEVVDQKGRLTAKWSSPNRKAYFTSISVSGKDIWVGDSGNRNVLRYNTSGIVTGIFAAKDSEKRAPGLILPSPHLHVQAAPGGSVWVSDPGRHQLELYGPDAHLKRAWGNESFQIQGFSGCCNPISFAIPPSGGFVTAEKGLPRVKVYRSDGSFDCVVAGREAFSPDVVGLDVTVDTHGRILVLDPTSRSIRVFVHK